jgi:hypothetical protein
MNIEKLNNHIKLCRKNLKANKILCCGNCPFEEEITMLYPEMKILFENKRILIKESK